MTTGQPSRRTDSRTAGTAACASAACRRRIQSRIPRSRPLRPGGCRPCPGLSEGALPTSSASSSTAIARSLAPQTPFAGEPSKPKGGVGGSVLFGIVFKHFREAPSKVSSVGKGSLNVAYTLQMGHAYTHCWLLNGAFRNVLRKPLPSFPRRHIIKRPGDRAIYKLVSFSSLIFFFLFFFSFCMWWLAGVPALFEISGGKTRSLLRSTTSQLPNYIVKCSDLSVSKREALI